MRCKKCNSEKTFKSGSYKSKGQRVQRYLCRDCGKTFTSRTDSKYYRKRKQKYSKKIVDLYCEGMSLRAAGRVLKLNRKTVERYFLDNANRAEEAHNRVLDTKGIITTYVQTDEMETFEHTHKRPLGIQLAIRVKTGEILSARVARIPMKAQIASPKKKAEYALLTNRKQKQVELLLDLEKIMKKDSTLETDGKYIARKTVNQILEGVEYESKVRASEMWRINKACLKLRQNVSRLRRQTLATTKKADRLQKHLALYIAYNNNYNVA